jgi:hypothetical protein
LEKKEMQLSICGFYADASDRAVFSAAVNNKKKKKEGYSNILAGVLVSGTRGGIAGTTSPRTVVSDYRSTAL